MVKRFIEIRFLFSCLFGLALLDFAFLIWSVSHPGIWQFWRQSLVKFDVRVTLEADAKRLRRKRREGKTNGRKERRRTQSREDNVKRN